MSGPQGYGQPVMPSAMPSANSTPRANNPPVNAALDSKKSQLMDQVDIVSMDILTTSEQTIKNMLDIKVKLHEEKANTIRLQAQIEEQNKNIDYNIDLLSRKNNQVEQNLKV